MNSDETTSFVIPPVPSTESHSIVCACGRIVAEWGVDSPSNHDANLIRVRIRCAVCCRVLEIDPWGQVSIVSTSGIV